MRLTQKQIYIVILSIFLLLMSGCAEEKKSKKVRISPPVKVEIVTMKNENMPIWTEFTGRTKASSEQEVRARVQGFLEEIYFEDGDIVKKGQKLFKVEQAAYKAKLASSEAKLKKDLAVKKLAKADVNRYKPLVAEGLAPRATLEQYQAKLNESLAQIDSDKAEINNAKLNLSYTIITAPVSGKISARRVDKGNLVGNSEATLLTTIMQIDPIYVYFSPSEKQMKMIRKYGKKKKLPVEMYQKNKNLKGKSYMGNVDFSDNTVDPLTSTVSMRAKIENSKYNIYPGSFVYVNLFLTDEYKFMMLPPEVILEDQAGKYVYVVDENSSSEKRIVKTSFTTADYVTIAEGLKDGDRVIISALIKLRNGTKVQPIDVTDTKSIKAMSKKKEITSKGL